jgi:uncharacterized protein YjdB
LVFAALAISLSAALALAACSGDDDPVAVTGVTVAPDKLTVTVNKTATLTATVAPAGAANKNVTWESDDETTATVTFAAPGDKTTVNGVALGTATITAKTEDGGFTKTCAVTVTPAVTGVTVNPTILALAVGGSPVSVTAAVLPEDVSPADSGVTWSSNKTDVATVSSATGATVTITAAAPGIATITATSAADPDKTAICTVTVAPLVEGVTVAPAKLSLAPNGAGTLTAAVLPSGTLQSVVWASDNTSVARVAGNGATATVTAVAEGKARITATSVGHPAMVGACDVAGEDVAIYMGGGFGLYPDGGRNDALDGNNVNNILIDAQGNVHVVGSHYSSASNQHIYPAVYYRNGVSIPLPMGAMQSTFESQARAIDIAPDGNAYIVGYEYQGDTIARLWKVTPTGDVETFNLPDTDPRGWEKSWANAVRWRDGSLYVAGGDQGPASAYTNHPVIWKDDAKYEMPGYNFQEIIDMAFAADGAIYVLGSNNSVYSVAPDLSGMTPVPFDAVRYSYSIFVDGNDLYLAGCTGASADTTVARYWKNGGAPIELESPADAVWAEAQDIFVYGGSVYAVGCSFHGAALGYRAQLWIDGELIQDGRSIDIWFQYYKDRKPACAYAYTVLIAPKRAQ